MKNFLDSIKDIFLLLRPKHWVKNLLVFTALIFSFSFEFKPLILACLAFVSYSFIASSVYVINDIFDAGEDRYHPKKKYRPIASGRTKIWQAAIIFALLLALSILIAININVTFLFVILFYFVLNIFYSVGLKNYAIIDVIMVASGFVLRVVAGSFAIGVATSHWLLLCTFFIALFLAFGKRKIEMYEIGRDNKKDHRKSILGYTDGFINQMLALSACISVVFYSLYTIDSETLKRFGSDNLIYTTPLVVFGVLRYFHLLYNKKIGGDPVDIFLKDLPLIAVVIVWIASVFLIYYFPDFKLN